MLGERLRGEGIKFDLVYSSSLIRAIKTARLMLDAMGEPERDYPKVDDIIEQQIPGWRGVPVEEVNTPELMLYRAEKGLDFVPPQGESLRMGAAARFRLAGAGDHLQREPDVQEPQNLTVAVVGHGTASRCLFQYIMGFRDSLVLRMAVDNTSISRFIFDSRGWSVVRLNDASHLANTEVSFEARP